MTTTIVDDSVREAVCVGCGGLFLSKQYQLHRSGQEMAWRTHCSKSCQGLAAHPGTILVRIGVIIDLLRADGTPSVTSWTVVSRRRQMPEQMWFVTLLSQSGHQFDMEMKHLTGMINQNLVVVRQQYPIELD